MTLDKDLPVGVRCEVCGSEVRWFADVDSYHHYRCRACSHLFVWPRPIQARLAEVYENESYYDRSLEQAARLRAEAVSRLMVLERLVAQKGIKRRLLDVGCATGLFLGEARARGWEAAGLERSTRMAQQAREATGAVVHTGLVEEETIAGAPYSVVTAWEVLEHAVDPPQWLAGVARNVAPGGLLALSTPRSDGLPARLMGSKFPMISPPEHLSLFSRKSLDILARRHGFEELEYRSFSNLTAVGLASGLSRLACGRPLQESSRVWRASLLSLGMVAAWIPAIVDRVGCGTEMLVVYRKLDS